MAEITSTPVPTAVVLAKFSNGFLNGFIFERDYITNIQDDEPFDIDFLMSVWRCGFHFGRIAREDRRN